MNSKCIGAILAVTGLFGLQVLAGCGDDEESTTPTGQGGAAGQAGATAQGGAAGQANVGGSAGSASSGKWGYVFAMSYEISAGGMKVEQSTVGAAFGTATTADCTIKKVDNCTVSACAQTTLDPDAGLPKAPSAGAITVSGGAKPVTVTPDADGHYQAQTGQSKLWQGGETLTFTAVGGDVPAFTGTITAPTKAVLTAPTLPASGSTMTFSKSAPPAFSWTGASSGDVLITVSATSGSMSHSVQCTYAASAGTGSLPAAALTDLPAGSGSLSLTQSATKDVAAGDFDVRIAATTMPTDATGMTVFAQLTIQ